MHIIPPITSEMGRSWRQPDRSRITIYRGVKAIMTQATFKALPEYSTTLPSGVYEGKMWKCQDCKAVDGRRVWLDTWQLRWYGPSDKPGYCAVLHLPIEIANPS